MEKTFVMVKPDGVQRGLVGEIIRRIERKGFKLVALKMMRISEELAKRHYQEHKDKPFFPELTAFITSGPVIAMVWEGQNVIAAIRLLMGDTNPASAAPGTIRGDLAVTIDHNLIHGSDSGESARREIAIFFSEDEFQDYQRTIEVWI
ncbi:MAG: nucleoside-diphosphate kinase [Syntrophomonadaceae bacterium]